MLAILSLFCTLIVAVSLLGGVTPLALVLNHTRLQVYLSFSAGTMLGAAFFHMLPEAVRMGSPGTVRWSAVGLLSLFFLERFFSFHHHESTDPKSTDAHDHGHNHDHADHGHQHGETAGRALSWGTAAFGLGIHSLVGGVALASAVAADFADRKALGATGLGVFLATLLHKPADAMTIVALMLRSGVSSRLAHLVNLGFALMIPLGAALFFVGVGNLSPNSTSALTAVALSFSAGTFLCIALSDLLPELQFHSHDRFKLSVALLAGFFLMVGTSAIEFVESAL
ncbi:MAG: ZIP family metal transporter [Paludisphaera borealis]|uniref:ZIP family metal transporter n=1 Tax=Paludisphaera borealis TaxID=1387353 RepID=UPI0028481011|nr:ZIP family metal transporter [Paludisphaera borealis]MDR3619975.1 ZIP family metal transporter [Paludisphaera borealis]